MVIYGANVLDRADVRVFTSTSSGPAHPIETHATANRATRFMEILHVHSLTGVPK
jgi:hypothetical protein